jgi:hypothetical protein
MDLLINDVIDNIVAIYALSLPVSHRHTSTEVII